MNTPCVYKQMSIFSSTNVLKLSVTTDALIPDGTQIIYKATIGNDDHILTHDPVEVSVNSGFVNLTLKAELYQYGRLSPKLKSMILNYQNEGHTTNCVQTKSGGFTIPYPLEPETTLSFWANCAGEVLDFQGIKIMGDSRWIYYTIQKTSDKVCSVYLDGYLFHQEVIEASEPITLGGQGGCRLSDMQFTRNVVDLDEIKKHARIKLPYYDKDVLENLDSSVIISAYGMVLQGADSRMEFNPSKGKAIFTNMDIENNWSEDGTTGSKICRNGDIISNNFIARGNFLGGSKIGGTKIYPFHVGQTIGGIEITEDMVGDVINATDVGDNPKLTDTTYKITKNQEGIITHIDDVAIIDTQLDVELNNDKTAIVSIGGQPVDASTVNGYTVSTSVPEDAKFTDTTYKITKNQEGVITHIDDVAIIDTQLDVVLNDDHTAVVSIGGQPVDASTVNGCTVEVSVPVDAKFTDTTYKITKNQEGIITHIDDVAIIDTQLEVVLNDDQTAVVSIGGQPVDASTVNGFTVSVDVPNDADFNNTQLTSLQVEEMVLSYLRSRGLDVNPGDSNIIGDNLIVTNGTFSGAIDAGPLFLSFQEITINPIVYSAGTITIKDLISSLRSTCGITSFSHLDGSIGSNVFDGIETVSIVNEYVSATEDERRTNTQDSAGYIPSWWEDNNPYFQKVKADPDSKYATFIQNKKYTITRAIEYRVKFYLGVNCIETVTDVKSQVVRTEIDKYPDTTTSTSSRITVESFTFVYANLIKTLTIQPNQNPWTLMLRNTPNQIDVANYPTNTLYHDASTGALSIKL